jgi:hypothetical protein
LNFYFEKIGLRSQHPQDARHTALVPIKFSRASFLSRRPPVFIVVFNVFFDDRADCLAVRQGNVFHQNRQRKLGLGVLTTALRVFGFFNMPRIREARRADSKFFILASHA